MKPTKRKKLRLRQTLDLRAARKLMEEVVAKSIHRAIGNWAEKTGRLLAERAMAGFFRCGPPNFADGDFVTRDGTDVHQVRDMTEDGFAADFVCLKAPASGWCAVGDVEHNLYRRYQKAEWPLPSVPVRPAGTPQTNPEGWAAFSRAADEYMGAMPAAVDALNKIAAQP